MAAKRKLQKEQTRQKIIAAATRVYTEQGFSAPTANIAREAQVSHGSVFVHFPTADSLLACVLDEFSLDMKNELHSLSASGGDIVKLLNMHIDILIKHERFYKRLITEAVHLPDDARDDFIVIQSTMSIHFLQALEGDIGAGKIKPIPLHMLFNTWLGLIHYYLLNGRLFMPGGATSVLQYHKISLIECFLALIKQ